jgi:poly(A) polymerase
MTETAENLAKAGIPFREYGITAVDRYCGLSAPQSPSFYLVQGSIIDLARIFESLQYPSLPYADAALEIDREGSGVRFLCRDRIDQEGLGNFAITDFRRDPQDGKYYDPKGVYQALREGSFDPAGEIQENSLFEICIYLSRLSKRDGSPDPEPPLPLSPSKLWQKDLLSHTLQGPNSSTALDFLGASGFIAKFWPELDALLQVDHAKDCHPEGGGWSHTMEALRYRKSRDLRLSLAILLHDIGKARSASREGRRFDKHAEIGAGMAARFLRDLGYDSGIIEDVVFMIRWHMLPAALPRIPIASVQDIVFDQRFPMLLELFRCDEFSSFKGPDVYYAACAAYRAFKKFEKNPYRERDGRKKSKYSTAAQSFSQGDF